MNRKDFNNTYCSTKLEITAFDRNTKVLSGRDLIRYINNQNDMTIQGQQNKLNECFKNVYFLFPKVIQTYSKMFTNIV